MHRIFVLFLLVIATPFVGASDVEKMRAVLPKFRQISPSIYAGPNVVSKLKDEGLLALAAFGIKTNINLQGGDIDGTLIGRSPTLFKRVKIPRRLPKRRATSRRWEFPPIIFP